MVVDPLDECKIKNHLFIRFIGPIIEALNMSFYDFLEKFILRVLITDSV